MRIGNLYPNPTANGVQTTVVDLLPGQFAMVLLTTFTYFSDIVQPNGLRISFLETGVLPGCCWQCVTEALPIGTYVLVGALYVRDSPLNAAVATVYSMPLPKLILQQTFSVLFTSGAPAGGHTITNSRISIAFGSMEELSAM